MKRNLVVFFIFIIALQIYFYFPNRTGIQDRWMVSTFFIDEHAQLMNFEGMFKENTVKSVLKYGYYYYGFPFFLLDYLIYLPVYLLKGINIPLLMLLMRQLSVLFGGFVLTVLFIIAKKITNSFFAFLYVLFIFFMPAFQRSMVWWHPDTMVLFFISLALYFLLCENWQIKRYFTAALISIGLSTAIKYVGILFTPTIFLYSFSREFLAKTAHKTKLFVKLVNSTAKSIILSASFILLNCLIFIFLNPLSLVSKFRTEYIGEFLENYYKNQYTLGDKNTVKLWLDALNANFFSNAFLVFASIGFIILITKKRKIGLTFIYFTVPYLIYLVISVLRVYPHYLLITIPLFSFGMIYLIYFLTQKSHTVLSIYTLFLVLVAVIFINQLLNNSITSGSVYSDALEKEKSNVVKIGKELAAYVDSDFKYHNKNIKIIKTAYTYVPERNNWFIQNMTAGITQKFVDDLQPDFIVILKSNLTSVSTQYEEIQRSKDSKQKNMLEELYKLNEPYLFYQKVISNTLTGYKNLLENADVLILEKQPGYNNL